MKIFEKNISIFNAKEIRYYTLGKKKTLRLKYCNKVSKLAKIQQYQRLVAIMRGKCFSIKLQIEV